MLTAEEKAYREQKIRELLSEGNKKLRQGDWDSLDRAQAAYSTARELDRDDARVIDGLGCVAWRKGNAQLAEVYFRRSIELNRDYDRPLAHLALVAESRGHHRASVELLRQAMELNPLNYRTRNNYAAVLMDTDGRSDEPQLAEAHRELLKAYELAGPEEEFISKNIATLSKRPGW